MAIKKCKTEAEINSVIVKSGKPIAMQMINIKSLETFYVPCIGLYRLGGDDPKKLLEFKTGKEAKTVADKYYSEWKTKLP